ncbi:hypothetical protein JXB31_01620, partial [Candidatus Woesearchaeota archaeon]|nr:hypothetical protein [Candidatus Woesearchaeota archaeon]
MITVHAFIAFDGSLAVTVDAADFSVNQAALLATVTMKTNGAVAGNANGDVDLANTGSQTITTSDSGGLAIGDSINFTCTVGSADGQVTGISGNDVTVNITTSNCSDQASAVIAVTTPQTADSVALSGIMTIPLQTLTNAMVSGADGVYDAGEGVYVSADTTLDAGDTIVVGETVEALTNAKVTAGSTGNVKDAGEGVFISADTTYDAGDTIIVGTTVQTLTNGKVTVIGASNNVLDAGEAAYDDADTSGNVTAADYRLSSISAESAVLGSPSDNDAGTNVAATAGWVKEVDAQWTIGDDIFIENVAGELTYSAAADSTIGGTGPAAGTAIDSSKDVDWTTLYFYDAAGGGAWAVGADSIWVDDGNVYYDSGIDTSIAGITVENTAGTAAAGAIPAAWLFDSIDAAGGGAWNAGADSIIIEADDNDYYLDQINAITAAIDAGATITSGEITNVKFWLDDGDSLFDSGADTLLGTATTGDGNIGADGYDVAGSEWYISGKSQNLAGGDSMIFVTATLNSATNGKTIKFDLQPVSGTAPFGQADDDAGLFLSSAILGDAANANFQTVDAVAPSAVLVDDHADNYVRDADTVIITATFTEADQIDETVPPTITIGSVVSGAAMVKESNLVWNYTWDVPAGNDGICSVTILAHDR